jgi:hypothetical protein
MELNPASGGERLRVLLVLMKVVGYELSTSGDVVDRVWGKHLLSDWRGLELHRQRDEMTELVRAAE